LRKGRNSHEVGFEETIRREFSFSSKPVSGQLTRCGFLHFPQHWEIPSIIKLCSDSAAGASRLKKESLQNSPFLDSAL
jgi:hypothetical protein